MSLSPLTVSFRFVPLVAITLALASPSHASTTTTTRAFSGIYPHLAYWNQEPECGTGAVVPWADRLWVMTYGPHLPNGSTDKLYEIESDLRLTLRPESVGGTHANRMIHRETQQLLMGPYAIDANRKVRVIPHATMPGRLTGTARHMTDPANKVYYATMEEGFYEVDAHTLEVTELYPDANAQPDHAGTLLPGYHGKGLYSGQGRLVYANNGERSKAAMRRPDVPSGCLAEWMNGEWRVVQRAQFTEVTGPAGIDGDRASQDDPIWSIGWDHRSLILMLLDGGEWYRYRLPKASHTYDGAHGWNTEWPRIRDVGEDNLLMTMHGAFWHFPKTFSRKNSAGIAQRRTYLKVIGDFARWKNQLVFGCDDSAKNEFLNKRKAKGELPGPGISHSNLWFVNRRDLDKTGGPARGNGAVWLDDPTTAAMPSDPFLFAGFYNRALHLAHDAETTVSFRIEVDRKGDNRWTELMTLPVGPRGTHWKPFTPGEAAAWMRLVTDKSTSRTSAIFTGSDRDHRKEESPIFSSLASRLSSSTLVGLLHAGGTDRPILHMAATRFENGRAVHGGVYEMNADLQLRPTGSAQDFQKLSRELAVPSGVLQSDEASLLYIDDEGRRFRLPRMLEKLDPATTHPMRVCREVCTERDLFHAGNTFYELPAENAGGFALIRPIASHPFAITDYCSWRGLLVLAGVHGADANPHIVRSSDGNAAVWLGAIDDLWKLGKARGVGGPWHLTQVQPGEPSDAFLCNGFDRKMLELDHNADTPVRFTVEADFSGRLAWHPYTTITVPAGETVRYGFPGAFAAYWLRLRADTACLATAKFNYY